MRLIYWHNLLSEFIAIASPIPPGSNEVLLKLTTVIIIIIVAAAAVVAVVAIQLAGGRRVATLFATSTAIGESA